MSPVGDMLMSLGGDILSEIMKNTKNREETSTRLISAVGELIAKSGFSNLGVNAIARQAGVDKVLIYRYFNGLDGLYKAYSKSIDFWPKVTEILGKEDEYELLKQRPFSEILSVVFKRYADAIRNRPNTLEVLAWETIERNSLTIELENIRESTGMELMARMQEIDAPEADWQVIINLFAASIHYLLIRGRKIKTFTGMDLTSDDTWDRINEAIEFLCQSVSSQVKGGPGE